MRVTRILVIDSYDSFVYNIVQHLGELGAEPLVYRNDALTVDEAIALRPDGVLLSPGPGRPEDAGIICELVAACAEHKIPLLGVCLGHQAIGHVYGATVTRAPELMHGKTSEITHEQTGVFAGLDSPLTVTRYHSLVVDRDTMPQGVCEITATSADGLIMGMRHATHAIEGVQFHPEAIMTANGHQLFRNFLASCSR